jgi:hypothetical protein
LTNESGSSSSTELRCSECQGLIGPGQDHEATEEGAVFCRPCFEGLTTHLQMALAAQGSDINYAGALAGGLVGAAAGILAWWGFTVVTNVAFGLVAVVIGVAVGKGIVMLSGGKRHLHLQIMSVGLSVGSFFYASYLVNRSFILGAMAEQGEGLSFVLPLLPSLALFVEVVKAGFGLMDLVFLGIVVYEAWKIPAPVQIPGVTRR